MKHTHLVSGDVFHSRYLNMSQEETIKCMTAEFTVSYKNLWVTFSSILQQHSTLSVFSFVSCHIWK